MARKEGKSRKYSEKEIIKYYLYIVYGVCLCYVCTGEVLVTVAACGSSPHAQSMAGFWLSASDGLVISSESLLGEVGREFPGLGEEKEIKKIKDLFLLDNNMQVIILHVDDAPLNGAPLSIWAGIDAGLFERAAGWLVS